MSAFKNSIIRCINDMLPPPLEIIDFIPHSEGSQTYTIFNSSTYKKKTIEKFLKYILNRFQKNTFPGWNLQVLEETNIIGNRQIRLIKKPKLSDPIACFKVGSDPTVYVKYQRIN